MRKGSRKRSHNNAGQLTNEEGLSTPANTNKSKRSLIESDVAIQHLKEHSKTPASSRKQFLSLNTYYVLNTH